MIFCLPTNQQQMQMHNVTTRVLPARSTKQGTASTEGLPGHSALCVQDITVTTPLKLLHIRPQIHLVRPCGFVLRVQAPVNVCNCSRIQERVFGPVLELGHSPLQSNLSINQDMADMDTLQ